MSKRSLLTALLRGRARRLHSLTTTAAGSRVAPPRVGASEVVEPRVLLSGSPAELVGDCPVPEGDAAADDGQDAGPVICEEEGDHEAHSHDENCNCGHCRGVAGDPDIVDVDSLSPEDREAFLHLHGLPAVDTDHPFVRRQLAEDAAAALNPLNGYLAGTPSRADAFNLSSSPESTKTIYLDFDGHTTTDPWWTRFANDPNDTRVAGDPLTTPAYSRDADDTRFSDRDLDGIIEVWQRVAEDFAPFDVNVTTLEPDVEDLINRGGDDDRWGMRVVIGGDGAFYAPAGGVAYLRSFNAGLDRPSYVFSRNTGNGFPKYTADATTHEAGHTVGLGHDGETGGDGEYYRGHGSGETGWGPIMGPGYYRQLIQFSKGEYRNATNTQDDLQVITTQNGFGYVEDDHAATDAEASLLAAEDASGPRAVDVSGVISETDDQDWFTFEIVEGEVDLTFTPSGVGTNLDLGAEIFDEAGELVASINPADKVGGSFTGTLAAGVYTLRLDGVGKEATGGGDDEQGYSDYGSLGQYEVTGTIPASPDTTGGGDPGSVSGVAFADADGDGLRQAGEGLLAGVTVWLDVDGDGVFDAGEPAAVTAADDPSTPGVSEAGGFALAGVAAGTYTLYHEGPGGAAATNGPASVTVTAGVSTAVDPLGVAASEGSLSALTGVLFADGDGDGLRGGGESGLAGATVYADLNNNGALDDGEPTATTREAGQAAGEAAAVPAGFFSLSLPGGMYTLRHDASGEVSTGAVTTPLGAAAHAGEAPADVTLGASADPAGLPRLSNVPASVTFTEGRPAVLLSRSALADTDSVTRVAYSVLDVDGAIVPASAPGGPEVEFRPRAGVTFQSPTGEIVAVGGAGDRVLFKEAPIGRIEAAAEAKALSIVFEQPIGRYVLRNVMSTAVYGFPGSTPPAGRQVRVEVSDGTPAGTAPEMVRVNINAVGDAPLIEGLLPRTTYVEGGGPVDLSEGVTVTDPDTVDFGGGRLDVRVVRNADRGDDFDLMPGSGVTAEGGRVLVGGRAVADAVRGPGGRLLQFTFLPGASLGEVAAVIDAVRYGNSTNSPSPGEKGVRFTLYDPTGKRDLQEVTVGIELVNDAPAILRADGNAVTAVEGRPPVKVASQFAVDDDDFAGGGFLEIAVPEAPADGRLVLLPDGSGQMTVAGDDLLFRGEVVASLTRTDHSVRADWAEGAGVSELLPTRLGRLVGFEVLGDDPAEGTFAVTYAFSDGELSAEPAASTVTIRPVNDPPGLVNATDVQSVRAGVASALFPNLRIEDPDTADYRRGYVGIFLSGGPGGQLALAAAEGRNVVLGGRTVGTVAISASRLIMRFSTSVTPQEVATLMRGITFTGNAAGTQPLQYRVSDGAGTSLTEHAVEVLPASTGGASFLDGLFEDEEDFWMV